MHSIFLMIGLWIVFSRGEIVLTNDEVFDFVLAEIIAVDKALFYIRKVFDSLF